MKYQVDAFFSFFFSNSWVTAKPAHQYPIYLCVIVFTSSTVSHLFLPNMKYLRICFIWKPPLGLRLGWLALEDHYTGAGCQCFQKRTYYCNPCEPKAQTSRLSFRWHFLVLDVNVSESGESQAHSTEYTGLLRSSQSGESLLKLRGKRQKQLVSDGWWIKAWGLKKKNHYYFELWIMQTTSSIDKDMQLKLSTMGPL